MFVLCNKTTKKIEGISRWDSFTFDPTTHVEIITQTMPDPEQDSLNDTNDGIVNVPPPLSEQEKIKSIEDALQAKLDQEAQSLGYDNIVTVVSYADEPAVPQFQTDGQSFRAWRSKVWAYAYQTLSDFKANVAAYKQYLVDKAAYDIAYAQWQIDVQADPTLVEPTAPTVVAKPVEPTPDAVVAGMPARV